MSLASQIDALATAIGQKIKAVQVHQVALSIPLDPLVVGVGIAQFVVIRPGTLYGFRPTAAVGKAPTGADLIFDVNKNGSTIFTTQANRPKVLAATTVGALAIPDIVAVAAGDVITIDVDQIGSTLAGSLATITMGMY
jgi:hypothetical protein